MTCFSKPFLTFQLLGRAVVGRSVCVSVCLSDGHVRENCGNGWTNRDSVWARVDSRVRPKWESGPQREWIILRVISPTEKHWEFFCCVRKKTVKPIEMPFGSWLVVGRRKHVSDQESRLVESLAAPRGDKTAMLFFVKILWPFCYSFARPQHCLIA